MFSKQECDEGKSFLVIVAPPFFTLGVFRYVSRGSVEKAFSQRNANKSESRERLGLFADKTQTKREVLFGLVWLGLDWFGWFGWFGQCWLEVWFSLKMGLNELRSFQGLYWDNLVEPLQLRKVARMMSFVIE